MAETWNVLVPRQIDPSGPESIADFAACTGMDEYDSVDAALDDIDRYDAVVVRVAELDAAVIDRADRLRVIAKHGAGLDNVDIEAASERGIVVCNTPGANSRSVAEHALSLLFALRRNHRAADQHVRGGGWDRGAYTGRELTGNTLGLFGFGAIARETSDLAHGIGQDVLMYDPYVPDDDVPTRVERVTDFRELFARSDAVSIHAPLTPETRHVVSTDELTALGERGVLINTARGPIVDEEALLEALDSGALGGAGLDTFEEEPPAEDHPLFGRDDVLLTPHVGGVTEEALARMSQRAAANVRTVYEGGVPPSTVNRDAVEDDAE
ncbi:hydroxyacid dehydrogenase [Haloarcula onubensis]|uniref:Hydroxyacid dehydrogenase n=1 Tax=Haloarcula onubensis TaxID=2950539 RepID=A0ABU2FL12_9EURY|nr:hydroxyacid dehydrogenase [Halomicroarcula sp. S3CR25-11]MDS0281423.1 hydroxyacid dehydrogenase [Halomicroarcula sp. S3CR25-11]